MAVTIEATMAMAQAKQIVVVPFIKSMRASIILTILFGPLGMIYSTIVKGQVNFPMPGPELFSTLGFSGERI